jgi:hypothetical protein
MKRINVRETPMSTRHEALIIVPMLLAACAGKTVDVGQDEEGATSEIPLDCNAIDAERAAARAEALIPALTETPAHAGVWTGYIEHHQFPSGSDKILLVLAQDGTGTVTFGEGELPPEILNPDLIQPMGYGGYSWSETQEGHPYPLYRVEVTGDRLRFVTRTGELFGPWCRMQMPYDWGMCQHSCIERHQGGALLEEGCFISPGSYDLSTREEVSCAVFVLCGGGGACECTAESCDFNASAGDGFDGTLTDGGTAMIGSFSSVDGNVRLFRE